MSLRLLLLGIALALLAPPTAAHPAGEEPHDDGEQTVVTVPVTIDGATLFRVRGVTGFPAERRAVAVRERLLRVARDPAFDPETLRLVETDEAVWITAADEKIVGVRGSDASLEQLSREELAAVWLRILRDAILDYRRARAPDVLRAGVLVALAATVALVALVFLWRWAGRRLHRWLEQRLQSAPSIGVSSFQILRAERLREVVLGLARVVRATALLGVVYVYLELVLGAFPWTRGSADQLGGWVVGPLRSMGQGVLQRIPNVIFLLVLFFVTRWALGVIRLFFEGLGRGTIELRNFEPAWAVPTFRLVRIGVIVFALVVAFPYIPGSQTPAFQGLSVFLGVLFSLGSSSVVANTVAGYSLTYRRAFKLGDWVRIGDVLGEVTAVRVQVTNIRTPRNEEVVVPNSKILNEEVTNYSTLARSESLLLHTTVGIGYETPWRQVEAMLLLAAGRTEGLASRPAPFVRQKSLGDFCVVYETFVGCHEPSRMFALYTALHRNILDVFNEYGVQIMTPAYEGDPEQPKIVPREGWFADPARPPAEAADKA